MKRLKLLFLLILIVLVLLLSGASESAELGSRQKQQSETEYQNYTDKDSFLLLRFLLSGWGRTFNNRIKCYYIADLAFHEADISGF